MLRRYLAPLLAVMTGLAPVAARADFDAGVAAYTRGDVAAAVAEWTADAAAGHVGAAWLLGNLYAQGKGVARSDRLAFTYFLQAAEAGHPGARVAVGRYYREGNKDAEVERDYAAALDWFDKAALQADGEAQYYLGLMHRNGEGVRRDRAESLRWYLLSVKKHYVPAFLALATIYMKGEGVPENQPDGAMYLALARAKATPEQLPEVEATENRLLANMALGERAKAAERAQSWLEAHPYGETAR